MIKSNFPHKLAIALKFLLVIYAIGMTFVYYDIQRENTKLKTKNTGLTLQLIEELKKRPVEEKP